ncbi:MAG: CaiB/BaiF CoA transferase family protein [Gemmatimonadaceae bacterium]
MTELLKDVRVLDLSRVLAGPFCGMTLGDLGADVIKVERPGPGDESRGWGPPFAPDGQSAYFLCTNRNKLGIALDLNLHDDRHVLADLVAGADVVIDNFPQRAKPNRLVDAEALVEIHSRLIWLTLTGFGVSSPRLGYDLVVQAECGWMSITGEPTGAPMKVGVALADVLAGKDAALSVLAALWQRDRSSEPLPVAQRRLHISLAHSAVAALVNVAQNVIVSGRDAQRLGNAHPNLVPYQAFRANDGYVVIAVGNDMQWARCCEALDLPSLGEDSTLSTNAGRLAQRERVAGTIAERVALRSAGDLVERLSEVGVPSGRVRSVREALGDVDYSALTGVSPAVPGSVRFPPPKLDEHGDVIRRLGWDVFKTTQPHPKR